MAKFVLEILDGDRAGEVLALGDGPLRIGRKPANDLVLADEKASGVHAEVLSEGGRFVLRDLGSTNGTLMDGRRITEVALSSGDTFLIGRVRLRFVEEGKQGGAADDDGMGLGRIDAGRLQQARGKGRSLAPLVLVLVVLLAGGGWFFFQADKGEDGGATRGPRAVIAVAGNRIDSDAASCESESGWDLRVAGAGFDAAGRGHTGRASLRAMRSADGPDFAVCATSGEIKALAGRTLTATAHVLTRGGAKATARIAFWNSADQSPFRFRSGLPLAASGAWEQRSCQVAVPAGMDRCRIEILCTLPDEGSECLVDDVALVEGGEQKPVEVKVGEFGTVIGVGSSLAVRSMDADAPATLLSVSAGALPAELAAAAAAGQVEMSDLGAVCAIEATEVAARLSASGCDALVLAFPQESAAGALAEVGDGFAGVDLGAGFAARRILVGDQSTRCLIELDEPMQCSGEVRQGQLRLRIPATAVRLQLGFRAERQQGREMLRAAEAALTRGEPGAALDQLRDCLRTAPHDVETAAAAVARRGELQAQVGERLRQLGIELDEAEFFDTRGGFERVVAEIDRLRAAYGERNLEDPDGVAAMRERAAGRLAQLDSQRMADAEKRLTAMAKAFEEAQQQGLSNLVRDYLKQRLRSKD